MDETYTSIPGPPGLPFVGNITDIDPNNSLRSFKALAEKYGEIYRLNIPGQNLIVLSTHRLVDETCDEKRFIKQPSNVLVEIRNGVHDGLFTAKLDEPNWGIAHRVLMPAFGPMSIRTMFDEMHDVCSQLVLKWARHGPNKKIMLTDDFTRLTLDTIALCSMGFRFNSFYTDQMHPFVDAMADFLTECGRRTQRVPLPSVFYRGDDRKFQHNIGVMRQTAEAVLHERTSDPSNERKDLLAAMLKGRDPKTGQQMSDGSIIDNLITFLVAGHETTSGMLSYATYQLLKHPEEYKKVQQEVDNVIGKGPITVQHMQKLPYVTAVLRETLRLNSPIAMFSVNPIDDTVLAGKYLVHKGDIIINLISNSHLDPEVFDEPYEFRPERMLDGNFEKLPKNAWKPFGNGIRACIGRPFAWQEAILAMAMIFQNFDLVLDDPDYKLEHKQTLTIKPKGLYARATLRDDLDPAKLKRRLEGTEPGATTIKSESRKGADAESFNIHNSGHESLNMNVTILYGSNSGTCESMAQSLARDAPAHGFKVSRLDCMDSATQKLPIGDSHHVVLIITASYEGQPPDNAGKFVPWVEGLNNDESPLQGMRYAVFGCGHHDWSSTFHRIPLLVNQKLLEAGGKRVAELGLADAAGDDMSTAFETWKDDTLWPALDALRVGTTGVASVPQGIPAQQLKVHVCNEVTFTPKLGEKEARVIDARTLTADGEPVKKHLEIQLPPGSTYRAGDYLAVLPSNPKPSVLRALRKFEISWNAIITLEGSSVTLPTNVAIYARTIFSDFVELGQPATRKNVLHLAEATEVEHDAKALKCLAEGNNYLAEISTKRVSVLDLLERFPSVKLDLAEFLVLLPPMRIRQYSISSSPLANPSAATITFSVLFEEARSGNGTYHGVASNYLASLQPEDPIYVSVRPCRADFHLPADAEDTPLILIAAGTGIAPFRGFIQERVLMVAKLHGQNKLAPALLYHGCREVGKDDLYTDELTKWEEMGSVTVRRAYSRASPKESANKYVQDAVWADREELRGLWKKGARIYICGSRAVSRELTKVAVQMRMEAAKKKGKLIDEAEAREWWDELRNVRHYTDVFD
ncbi:hypothetical protein DL766_000991 [Monosporascus sp. MC13-8B]|uniref:Bifunctional cytochrome P450/NADPH--P450 reductase n=1 Tax=Monosporascus cannonballus TaxID=155416 RepID=A0ABY0H6M6_9PEZI|nr:hypothetical protein DL762_005906 [Monosporascus cannonballus]RYO92689.1 hypothetical protein DL763_004602 [Monosporascus cannonballus]RYP38413.1 hypothetical protein DL766_000991 [Monosporascus sp. MC13-8B]